MRFKLWQWLYVILSSFATSLSLFLFAYKNASAERYWDAQNYFAGYFELVNAPTLSLQTVHFGRETELLLPLIYHVTHEIWPVTDVRGLILLHMMLFLIFIVPAYFFLARYYHLNCVLDKSLPKSDWFTILPILVFMAMTPLGAPLQLARQAIGLAILLFTFGVVNYVFGRYRFRKVVTTLISGCIVLFSHVANITTLLFLLAKPRFKYYIIIFSGTSALLFLIFIGSSETLGSNIFALTSTEPFSNIYLNLFLMNFIVMLFFKSIAFSYFNIILTLIVLCLAIYPVSFIFRLLYGLESIILGIAMLIVVDSKIRKNFAAQLMCMSMCGIILLKISYVIKEWI